MKKEPREKEGIQEFAKLLKIRKKLKVLHTSPVGFDIEYRNCKHTFTKTHIS